MSEQILKFPGFPGRPKVVPMTEGLLMDLFCVKQTTMNWEASGPCRSSPVAAVRAWNRKVEELQK